MATYEDLLVTYAGAPLRPIVKHAPAYTLIHRDLLRSLPRFCTYDAGRILTIAGDNRTVRYKIEDAPPGVPTEYVQGTKIDG